MQQALVRLIELFVENSGEIYPDWDVFHSFSEPGEPIWVPDDIPVAKAVNSCYENSIRFRCKRACCKDGPDECAHRLSVYFSLYEEEKVAYFNLVLAGLPDHDAASFPRIEGSTEYDIDSFPAIRFAAPTINSVLDAGKRILAQVPEWHQFLAADTIDWETRLDMRMS
jgi:hypothetical protein